MPEVFVLQNQHDQFLTKQREWIHEGDSKTLFRSELKDELINEKVELTVKNPDLRLRLVAADLQTNGRIFIEGEECVSKPPSHELETDAEIFGGNDSTEHRQNYEEAGTPDSTTAELELSGTHS